MCIVLQCVRIWYYMLLCVLCCCFFIWRTTLVDFDMSEFCSVLFCGQRPRIELAVVTFDSSWEIIAELAVLSTDISVLMNFDFSWKSLIAERKSVSLIIFVLGVFADFLFHYSQGVLTVGQYSSSSHEETSGLPFCADVSGVSIFCVRRQILLWYKVAFV